MIAILYYSILFFMGISTISDQISEPKGLRLEDLNLMRLFSGRYLITLIS